MFGTLTRAQIGTDIHSVHGLCGGPISGVATGGASPSRLLKASRGVFSILLGGI